MCELFGVKVILYKNCISNKLGLIQNHIKLRFLVKIIVKTKKNGTPKESSKW